MSAVVFALSEMSPLRRRLTISPAAETALRRMAVEFGQAVRNERRRRKWTLRVGLVRRFSPVSAAPRPSPLARGLPGAFHPV